MTCTGQVGTSFQYSKNFAVKAPEKAEYMEVASDGKITCDQKILGRSNFINVNVKIKIRSVTIKADEMEWPNKGEAMLTDGKAKEFINDLIWIGVEKQLPQIKQ